MKEEKKKSLLGRHTHMSRAAFIAATLLDDKKKEEPSDSFWERKHEAFWERKHKSFWEK